MASGDGCIRNWNADQRLVHRLGPDLLHTLKQNKVVFFAYLPEILGILELHLNAQQDEDEYNGPDLDEQRRTLKRLESALGNCEQFYAGIECFENDITGVIGECGGCCSCATCHVYIDPEWLAPLGFPSPNESDMLAMVEDLRSNSRLGCQIDITDELDGIIVRLPEFQI